MAVPGFQEFMRPLLALGLIGEVSMREAIPTLADQFGLTEEDRAEQLPSGQVILYNRVHWARTYLDKAGALKKTRRGHFELTDRGRELLKDHPDAIRVKNLKMFDEFMAFHAAGRKETKEEEDVSNDIAAETPEELIAKGTAPRSAGGGCSNPGAAI